MKKIAKSYARGSIRLRKVVNHSDITVPLWNDKERLIWRVGNKKSEEIPAGKTAKAKGKKYPIEYYLNGARLKGKMPKYHEYGIWTKLPRVTRKGYTFLGWDVYDFSRDENFGYVQTGIKDYYYGKIEVYAECKKYKVTVRNRRIHVMVKSPTYGKKGYYRRDDYYGFRYSENEDMSNAVIIDKTAPYGKGLSGKLKKGKTYYVEISPHAPAMFEEDDEDFPAFAWRAKRKVKIK